VQQLAHAKALLGLVTVLTAPGIPMLYAGQEFGEDAPRTIDFQPLHWDRLRQPGVHAYLRLVKRLLAARRTQPALTSDHIRFYPDNFAQEQVVRFERLFFTEESSEPADFVAVALNFGAVAREIELALPWSGCWQELISEQSYRVEQCCRLTLAPWQAVVLAHHCQ